MTYIIGLDIGGTKIDGILWDGSKVVRELTIITPNNLASFQKNLLKLVDFLSAGQKVSGVGISMAGRINKEKGVVAVSPNISYVKNLDLLKLVRGHGYKNSGLDNDAACFLLYETVIGAAKKSSNVFGMIIGTGVGGAMKIDGRMYRGRNNMGGEIGRLKLGKMVFDGRTLEEEYHKSKRTNDFRALRSVFAMAFANIINLLAPEAIVVGGTFARLYYKKFLTPALADSQKYVGDKKLAPKLIISKNKHAGAIGAALLVS